MSEKLKQECEKLGLAIGNALYGVIQAMELSVSFDSESVNRKVAEAIEEEGTEETVEEEKTAPKKRGPKPKAKEEERVGAVSGSDLPVQVVEERVPEEETPAADELDDFLEEKTPEIMRTPQEVKALLLSWVDRNQEKNRPRAIMEFTRATGLTSLKDLNDSNVNQAYAALETHLKTLK